MILIVQSLWNESITSKLVASAQNYLKSNRVESKIIQVPGALEIPLAIKWEWAKAQRKQSSFFGAVACATIIKGDTYHFEIVANESARALMDLSLELRIPIGNAVLAVYTIDQAIDRAGIDAGTANKGEEAARATLEMHRLREMQEY